MKFGNRCLFLVQIATDSRTRARVLFAHTICYNPDYNCKRWPPIPRLSPSSSRASSSCANRTIRPSGGALAPQIRIEALASGLRQSGTCLLTRLAAAADWRNTGRVIECDALWGSARGTDWPFCAGCGARALDDIYGREALRTAARRAAPPPQTSTNFRTPTLARWLTNIGRSAL